MHKATLLLCLVLAAPFTVAAQDSPKRTDSVPTRPTSLDTVAVHAKKSDKPGYRISATRSATKTNIALRDVPQSVTVLPKTLLADQSAQSMSEIARFIPGITFSQGEGHRDAPTIRGNASTADFYVDGVRDDAQYLRDTYNVERIEALKGPNAMVFGRGGAGGVINRVTKTADWMPSRSLTVEGGSYDHKRVTADFGSGVSPRSAARLNAMAENSGSFRAATSLSRRAVNPVATAIVAGNLIRASYEYLADERTVNRGIPSFQGRPGATSISTFFGDPDASHASLYAHNAAFVIEREVPDLFSVRNRTVFSRYDKLYQNVLPGAVTSDGSHVALSGYRNSHDRRNLFNQTDIVYMTAPRAVRHTILLGAEIGRQDTDNFRETGFFGSSTSLRVPFSAPQVHSGVMFRQSATDADNNVRAAVAAVYAQEQIAIGQHIQVIAGARGEQFTLDFTNHRATQKLSRTDVMVSPRLGLVVKPIGPMSIYSSLTVSHLPGSGDQFSSLTANTQTLQPEEFRNREAGLKWDFTENASFSTAVYRLDRTNSSAPDPADPSRLVQTGAQRSSGLEANLVGNFSRLQMFAGFTSQRAEIRSRTTASRAGATVPMVPSRTVSLWSRYDFSPRVGAGLGLVGQSKMFAAIDNSVTLPGFARTDGALYLSVARNLRIQANIENLFNTRYFANSQGNNNIMPGAPRMARISLNVY
jgi:catecholate siderophore receptor